MKRLFSLPNVQFIALLLALFGKDNIALIVSCYFVLGVNQSLSVGVGGFELHWDAVFLEEN